jgi:hypothetical protein
LEQRVFDPSLLRGSAVANTLRKTITVAGDRIGPFATGGMSRIGFAITGTWVGTLTFRGSQDGLNFIPFGVVTYPDTVGGVAAPQLTTTANGNFQAPVKNFVAWDIQATSLLSGSATIVMATSIDSSWQDAFLVASSMAVSQKVAGGAANSVTVAAQAQRALRLRTLSIAMSVSPGAAVDVQVLDGGSTVLWEGYVPPQPNGVSGGFTWTAPLPADSLVPGTSGGGVVNTIGNSLVITLAAPAGSVVSTINAEIIPA